MSVPTKRKRLLDAYRFPGFRPDPELVGVFGDPRARVVRLWRHLKKTLVIVADRSALAGTTTSRGAYGICLADHIAFIWNWK